MLSSRGQWKIIRIDHFNCNNITGGARKTLSKYYVDAKPREEKQCLDAYQPH